MPLKQIKLESGAYEVEDEATGLKFTIKKTDEGDWRWTNGNMLADNAETLSEAKNAIKKLLRGHQAGDSVDTTTDAQPQPAPSQPNPPEFTLPLSKEGRLALLVSWRAVGGRPHEVESLAAVPGQFYALKEAQAPRPRFEDSFRRFYMLLEDPDAASTMLNQWSAVDRAQAQADLNALLKKERET